MVSHQTKNLGLCQWEADDEVLRVDFNADNEKIDAAVTQAQTVAATAQAAAKSAASTCYSPSYKPYAAGTYTGDGAATRTISVGFTPSAVLVTTTDGDMHHWGSGYNFYRGGLAVLGGTVGANGLEVVSGGFQVAYSGSSGPGATNSLGGRYNYIAFR